MEFSQRIVLLQKLFSVMTTMEQQKAARLFAQEWQGKGYEKGESQVFWIELLTQVFGIDHPSSFISFEDKVKLDHTAFIDGYIAATHVLIEQKSIEKDLGAPIKQSDGTLLAPFQQAKRYSSELPYSQRPRWIVTCNFREFRVYDMEQPNGEPQKIALANLGKEYYRLQFLVDEGNEHLRREMEVSVKAGELVGMIYNQLLKQYRGADGSSAKLTAGEPPASQVTRIEQTARAILDARQKYLNPPSGGRRGALLPTYTTRMPCHPNSEKPTKTTTAP